MYYQKQMVEVIALFDRDGKIIPLEIIWIDQNRYRIDKVLSKTRAPSRTGGLLVERYCILVEGQQRYLYYQKEGEKWFVEKMVK
jgi:hypothetical protein